MFLLFRKISLGFAGLLLALMIMSLSGFVGTEMGKGAGFAATVFLALGLGAIKAFKGYQYTAWIVAAVVGGMTFPERFLQVGNVDLRNQWLLLGIIQLVMFGMGTQMSIRDFNGVVRSPRGVVVGLVCQFTIMPVMGWILTRIFEFPVEIAAGIILIGSCSSGLASNVMTYLAKANLALSVTVTAVATLLAPLMTPLLMKIFASTLVEVKFWAMMMSIVKMVMAPIGAALLADYMRKVSAREVMQIRIAAGICLLWLIFIGWMGWDEMAGRIAPGLLASIGMFGFFCAAVVFGVLYHRLHEMIPGMQRWMPYASMFGIVYFTAVTTAAGRDHLMEVGGWLLFASILHNTAGYGLGYGLSRLLGLDKSSARAMALEVGLQNGGMASGIAGAMGKLGTLGLASAVFSPWMNISGSILANIWGRRPLEADPSEPERQPE